MTQTPRKNDEKILFHMGKVEQHMQDDATFKANFIVDQDKLETRIGKVENRQTKTETRMGFVLKTGAVTIAAVIGFVTKGYWKGH